jgi:hypothetical protein
LTPAIRLRSTRRNSLAEAQQAVRTLRQPLHLTDVSRASAVFGWRSASRPHPHEIRSSHGDQGRGAGLASKKPGKGKPGDPTRAPLGGVVACAGPSYVPGGTPRQATSDCARAQSGLLKTDVPRSAGRQKACRQPARVSPKRSATAAIRFTSLLEAPAILLVGSPKIGVLSTTGVAEGILGQVTTGVTIAG